MQNTANNTISHNSANGFLTINLCTTKVNKYLFELLKCENNTAQ